MRGLVALLVLVAAQVLVRAPVLAAPNDFRVISGTLIHPATLGAGVTVAVFKGDEGIVYYADLRAVSAIPPLERGATVTLVGFERSRPDQLMTQVMYPADVAPADAPSVRSERINGRIGSLAGPNIVIRAADGSENTIVLRGITATTREMLHRGDLVTIFGRSADTDFEVTGIIQYQDCFRRAQYGVHRDRSTRGGERPLRTWGAHEHSVRRASAEEGKR